METPTAPCCSTPNCCCDKKKCVLCGIVAIAALLLIAILAFSIGKQLGLKQVPLCSPCPACERCPQSLTQPSANPTTEWKTYKNNAFSLKYPDRWFVGDSEVFGLFLKDNPPIGIIVVSSKNKMDLKRVSLGTPEKITIGGVVAEKVTYQTPDNETQNYIQILRNNTYFVISYKLLPNNEPGQEIDQILSTFRFD